MKLLLGLFLVSSLMVGQTRFVTLNWTASITVGVVGYNIYRADIVPPLAGQTLVWNKINVTPIAAITYDDTAVVGQMIYFYKLTAVDGSGNESVFSNQAEAVMNFSSATGRMTGIVK
jgi:hypothetical protein